MQSTAPTTMSGHVAHGQIVLNQPLNLPEGMAVDVVVTAKNVSNSVDDLSGSPLREQLKGFLEHQVDDLPPDAAENHDHYLYGTPKK
jgi:hypothetical protein